MTPDEIRLRLVELAHDAMAWRPTTLDQQIGYVEMVTALAERFVPYVEHGPDESPLEEQIKGLTLAVAAWKQRAEQAEASRNDLREWYEDCACKSHDYADERDQARYDLEQTKARALVTPTDPTGDNPERITNA